MLGKNQKLLNRILSSVLALMSVISLLPVQVYSVDEEPMEETPTVIAPEVVAEQDVEILTSDGESIDYLRLSPYDKQEVRVADATVEAAYQWQILHPEQEGLWVNICDATESVLPVTMALVGNVLSEDDTAQLRCRITQGEEQRYSSVLTVVIGEEEPVMAMSTFALTRDATDATEETTPEFVTVTIKYIRYDYVDDGAGEPVLMEIGDAFTSYVAALRYGTPLKTTVSCPTIVGYDSYLEEVKCKQVDINLDSVTSNVVYTVKYMPAEVDYEVRYFFQNIYDDLYVEDEQLVEQTLKDGNGNAVSYPVQAQGETGTNPDMKFTQAEFDGFTSLYYEPEKIAADGSTVFHVYYERNYCLMEFDCAGGYGTDTLYVRYGTYISVPNPVKSGYVFDGWDLVRSDGSETGLGDKQKDNLPETMPPYNTAYKALWTTAQTSYSIAYWLNNSDGTKTYIGGRTEEVLSTTPVHGDDDLTADTIICGLDEYEHSVACYECGKAEHIHHTHTFDGCIKGLGLDTNGGVAGNDMAAIYAADEADNTDSDSDAVYFYFIQSQNDINNNQYWPKIQIGDTYYTIAGIASQSRLEELIDADVGKISTGYSGGLYAHKYKAKVTCGKEPCGGDGLCSLEEHDHDISQCVITCSKQEHSHSNLCKATDRQFMEFVDADGYGDKEDIPVAGDGSTVVNVYYEYKTYTFYFYYAKEVNNQFYVFGGSTWGFSEVENRNIPEQLSKITAGHWGAVAKPTLNDDNKDMFTEDTYHEHTVNGETGKYYYITLSARYGEDISQKWPANPFNPVKTSWTYDYGDDAYFSAWNVDANTKYDKTYQNKTLKGNYQKLDDMLLIDGETTELYYLGFWENGDPDVGWNKPNKWIYNIYIPDASGEYQREERTYVEESKHGKGVATNPPYVLEKNEIFPDISTKYSLYGTYTIYDDNSNNYTSQSSYSPYCGQTPTALEGYRLCYHIVKHVEEHDSTYQLNTYQIDFYYVANTHSLKFWNKNNWLGDGQGAGNVAAGDGVKFDTPLSLFGDYVDNGVFMNQPAQYPDGLEPGAYEFVDWYTSSGCYDGTEVDWSGTMPDSDLTLYAKWVPVVHNVYFYYNYEDYTSALTASDEDKAGFYWYYDSGKTDPTYPIPVNHNELLGTTHNKTPDPPTNQYTFVGWFYIDQEGKKRFAPDTMEVKEDLHLFAEWKSGIDTQYTVNYVMDGTNTIIAAPTTGHLTAGKTKTFTAKVGTELLPDYQQENLFPMSNSHSILMAEDSTQNTYTFLYKEDDKVYYRVRYLDKENNTELAEEKIAFSTNAIITEKFKPVTGYYPTEYYIRKVLAYDGTEGSETNIIADNEIIFYYTKDEKHGPFVVEYYTPVLGATESDLYETVDGKLVPKITIKNDDIESPNPYWYLQQYEIGMADLDPPVTISKTVEPNKFNGFLYEQATVTTYDADNTESVTYLDSTAVSASGTVTQNGLEIRFFYARKSYDYIIKFVEYGTDKILGYGELVTQNVLNAPLDAEGPFESTISYTAPETIEKEGTKYIFFGTVEKPQTQSWTIRASDTENVLTFYYKVKTVGIIYTTVCSVPGAKNYGYVDLNAEQAATSANISGSVAYAANGFEFKGWYTDKAHTNRVASSWEIKENGGTRLKVQTLPDVDVVTYYALFEPVQEDLVIKKTCLDSTNDDTFLFRVTGTDVLGNELDLVVSIQGIGSVTIKDLYCGTYTVTELTNWSWTCENTDGSKTVTLTTQDKDGEGKLLDTQITSYELVFTNMPKSVDWLHGESTAVENQFTINQVS